MSIYDFSVQTIELETKSLADYQGQVLLIVNVASKCGLTPQYTSLQALYKSMEGQAFEILGFPCNQFLGQEPGTEAEIQEFCSLNYDVTFPLFAKIDVNGEHRHPLYQWLIAQAPEAVHAPDSNFKERMGSKNLLPEDDSDVMWNFEKFLVGRNGEVLGRFAPDMSVDHPILQQAITAAL